MPQDLIQLNTRSIVVKLLLLALLLAAGTWSYFVVRWYIGNTLAEYFNPEEDSIQTALRAVSLEGCLRLGSGRRVTRPSKRALELPFRKSERPLPRKHRAER